MAATTAKKAAATEEPASLVLTFEWEKDTKNTLRFREVSDLERPAVGTLYITKEALNDANLGDFRKITVTVEAS